MLAIYSLKLCGFVVVRGSFVRGSVVLWFVGR